MFQRVLDLQLRVLGQDDPDVLRGCSNLANYLGGLGRHAQAAELSAHVLYFKERVLGPEHRDSLRCSGNLALWMGQQGQYAQAAQWLQRILDATRTRFSAAGI